MAFGYQGYQPGYQQPYQPYVPSYMPTPQTGSYQFTQQQAQPQQMPQPAQQDGALLGRAVTSREEALGVPVDFMGNAMYFPDWAHRVIYCKKFNPNTGAADIFEFKLDVPKDQEPAKELSTFVALPDFEALKSKFEELAEDFARIKDKRQSAQKGAIKDE